MKAPGLSRCRPRMPALPLFVRRASPPKSLLSKASVRSRTALSTRPPQLHSPRTTVPSLATPSRSPPNSLLTKLDALILAAQRLLVSKDSLLGSIAPDLALPVTSMLKTMTPRAFMRTHTVRRSTPLDLQLVGVRGLFMEHLRTRSLKSFPMPLPLALAASHQSRML